MAAHNRELRELCTKIGYPVPRGRRGLTFAILKATVSLRIRRLRGAATPGSTPSRLEAADVLWSLVCGLIQVDSTFSRLLQLHYLRAALVCGEKTHVARALSLEMRYVAQDGSLAGPRLARSIAEACAAAKAADRPDVRAIFRASCAVAAALRGQWAETDALCRSAEQLLRSRCGEIRWVLDLNQHYQLLALWYLGRTDELVQVMPAYLADAEADDDRQALARLRRGSGFLYWLVSDQLEEARTIASDAPRPSPDGDFGLEDYFSVLADAQLALYQGAPEDAFARVAASRRGFARSPVRRVQLVRIEWIQLTARSALAAAATRSGAARAQAITIARACAQRLSIERAPWTTSLHALIHAGVARVEGDDRFAVAQLEHAVEAAALSGMTLHALAARHRMGECLGGREGRALCTEVETWLFRRSVVNPLALLRVLAPGWP